MKAENETLSSCPGSQDRGARKHKNVRLVHRKKPEINPFMADMLGQVKVETESLLRMMDEHMRKNQQMGIKERQEPE